MKNEKILVVTKLGIAQILTWGSTFFLPAILADSVGKDLGLSVTHVYACLSCALVLSATLSPLMGRSIDIYGGKYVLSGSAILFAMGLITMGLSPSIYIFFLGWILIGLGMSMGLYDMAFAAVARIFGQQSRSSMVGVTLIGGLTSLVSWPLSNYMEAEWGWRIACFVWAGTHLCISFPLYYSLPKAKEKLSQPPQTKSSLVEEVEKTVETTTDRVTMGLVAILFVFITLTASGTSTNLPILMAASGLSNDWAIAAAALFGPAQILGRSLDLFIANRYHPFYAIRFAFLFHPLGVIAIFLFGAPAAPLFVIMHGVGNGVLTTAMGTVPLLLFGSKGYGWRQGLLTVPRRIGMATAPFVFALMLANYGVSALFITATTCILGLITLLIITSSRNVQYNTQVHNTHS